MPLKYKTFDQLMAGIESDLPAYADEGLIDRRTYIKTARKVNADLGLKIYQEKEAIIDVKDYKSTVPFDFMYLQLALACMIHYSRTPVLRGTQTEQHSTHEEEVPVKMIGVEDSNCMTQCGTALWITEKRGHKNHVYQSYEKISIGRKSHAYCSDTCLNFRFTGPNQMNFDNDGETVHFSFREGKVYLNYLSDMVDDDNNILILDHPLVNDYYEYAIKNKFFENMELNKQGDFIRDFQLTDEKLRRSKREALGIVNTPEYGELINIHNANRRRFYNQYVRYFDEYNQGIFRV